MDLATSVAVTGNPSAANWRTKQVTPAKAGPIRPNKEDTKTQVNLIRTLASQGHNYTFIEGLMNQRHAPVASVVRQELWLTFNHEHLSKLLRWHDSEVRDHVRSNPVTYNSASLYLTLMDCTYMRNEMSRRMQEMEQNFQGPSDVKWGAKLRNYAKWEYLKTEIVLLYAWLKQKHASGRSMNIVCKEMTRRYGQLFDFKDTTYFTKFREWGIDTSSHDGSTLDGSSQQATPWPQPDTPLEPTTPFDNNATPGKDNWIPGSTDTCQNFHPPPLLVRNKTTAFLPQLSLAKDISSLDLRLQARLPLHPSPKLDFPQDIESDMESYGSHCSAASVGTVASEIHSAIDEEMSNWESPKPIHPTTDAELILQDWNANTCGEDDDVDMQEAEEEPRTKKKGCSLLGFFSKQSAPPPAIEVATKVQTLDQDSQPIPAEEQAGSARHLVDSGYADEEPITLLEAALSTGKIAPTFDLASNNNSRSRIPRPKPIPGGPTPLVDVALQTLPPWTQSPAKVFGKSVENLRLISKLQNFQTENSPSLHQLASTIYDQNVDSMMDLMISNLPQCQNGLMLDKAGNTAGHIALSSPRNFYQPEFPTYWWITTWLGCGNDGIEYRNNEGATILHYAAQNGYALVVKELLGRGADPDARDYNGRSVIQVCDDALKDAVDQVAIAQMPASASSTSDLEVRVVRSARLFDCAQLLRHKCWC